MAKCPFCETNVTIEDFFHVTVKETKKGKVKKRVGDFKGDVLHLGFKNYAKMWACPSCDKILGFSEYKWDSG